MVTRTRTKGGFIPVPGYIFGGPAGAPQVIIPQSGSSGAQTTTTDVVTPNFRKIQAAGGIVNNAFQLDRLERKDELADTAWAYFHPSHGRPWEDGGIRPLDKFPGGLELEQALPSVDPLLVAEAVNKANANVQPNYSMLYVSYKELDKTRAMFRQVGSTARAFSNAMYVAANAVRGRRNSKRAQHEAMQAIAGTWMQYRYGWLPTYLDLRGSIRTFQDTRRLERTTSRARSSSTSTTTGTKSSSYLGSDYGYPWVIEKSTEVRCGVLWEDKLELLELYASRLGLSAADAFSVPYELMPFSWLLDWFLDVGNWLRAITPKHGTNTLASWTTVRRRVVTRAGPAFVAPGVNGVTTRCSGGYSFAEALSITRTPSANPTIPGYGTGLSLPRSIDAAMLSIMLLKKQITPLSGVNITSRRREITSL